MIYESEKVAIPFACKEDAIHFLEGQWAIGRHVAYFVIQHRITYPVVMAHARVSQITDDLPPRPIDMEQIEDGMFPFI